MTTVTDLPQGDVRLLDTDVARDLLASTELARLAYVAPDGTPRVMPMMFHWTGEELVFCTFGGTHKLRHLRARPDVAVTIDTADVPPRVLLLRGPVTVVEAPGVLDEYAWTHRRYYGPEQAAASVAEIEHPDLVMARIGLRPTWVGLLDFVSRFPGGTAEDFALRGRRRPTG